MAVAGFVLGPGGFPLPTADPQTAGFAGSTQDPEFESRLDLPEELQAILWVDDNPDNNERESARLRAHGIRIALAQSTEEALERYDAAEFQLVISDIGRYEGGVYDPRAGLELLSLLQERNDTVRVIFYTSPTAVTNFADEAKTRGAAGITDSTEELFRLIG